MLLLAIGLPIRLLIFSLLLCRKAPSRYFERRIPEVLTLYRVYQKKGP